jgi:hypothetical protein
MDRGYEEMKKITPKQNKQTNKNCFKKRRDAQSLK